MAFGSSLGDNGSIARAMARRNMGMGGAPPESPASAGFQQGTQIPSPPPAPSNAAPVAQGSLPPEQAMQQPPQPTMTAMGVTTNPEATLIVKALSSRLSKLQ